MTPREYARITARIEYGADGCWRWTGAILKPTANKPNGGGYGLARANGKTALLHRAMYEHLVGPIAFGATIDHLCRVRACCNPAHLEPVTQKTNNDRAPDCLTTINTVKTECPKGHPYSAGNLYIDKTGRRHCRECRRARTREWYANKGGLEYHRAWNERQKQKEN